MAGVFAAGVPNWGNCDPWGVLNGCLSSGGRSGLRALLPPGRFEGMVHTRRSPVLRALRPPGCLEGMVLTRQPHRTAAIPAPDHFDWRAFRIRCRPEDDFAAQGFEGMGLVGRSP